MRFSATVDLDDVQEAYRLMRDAIRTSALDPTTGKIDMGMLNTGTGVGQRKMREDMRRELLSLLEGMGGGAASRGVRWVDAVQKLQEQSSVKVDVGEFREVIARLEQEGMVKVVGEREKRTIRRVEGA